MRPFDIFIAYVDWGDGGKHRPVLVYSQNNDVMFVFSITTKPRPKHFKIIDWAAAGLHKPSFVDISSPIKFSLKSINSKTPIGHLSDTDKKRLMQFLVR